MSKTCAIVPAAGRGLRMGTAMPKQFLELSGKPLLWRTLETLAGASFLAEILLVVPREFLAAAERLVSDLPSRGVEEDGYLSNGPSEVVPPAGAEEAVAPERPAGEPTQGIQGIGGRVRVIVGGAERQDSVFNGLQALPSDCDWVVIHDGVRPFVTPKLLRSTWEAALKSGAAIAALPASDTVKRVQACQVVETLPREEIWLVQTPQVFRRDVLVEAYEEARRRGWVGTDDAFLVERLRVLVTVVLGERSNIKVTTREDLAWGSWFLNQVRHPGVSSQDMENS